jgi:hypothetical protein
MTSHARVAADALLRQEPEEDEEKDEGDGNGDDDDDDDDDDGYWSDVCANLSHQDSLRGDQFGRSSPARG